MSQLECDDIGVRGAHRPHGYRVAVFVLDSVAEHTRSAAANHLPGFKLAGAAIENCLSGAEVIRQLRMDPALANMLLIISVVIGAPFFILFGWLSDKVGRKPVLMLGLLLATALYFPIFKGLAHYTNPAMDQASRQAPITVLADPATCTFQFDPVGKARFDSPCDKVKTFLVKQGLPYSSAAAPAAPNSLALPANCRR